MFGFSAVHLHKLALEAVDVRVALLHSVFAERELVSRIHEAASGAQQACLQVAHLLLVLGLVGLPLRLQEVHKCTSALA